MRKIAAFAIIVIVASMGATQAMAEHTAEHVQQSAEALTNRVLPAGYSDTKALYTYEQGYTSLDGLAYLCTNNGGYWYYGSDGYYYWNSCQ